ncbi:hypothetical protein PR202_gb26618 [Eleusine coracana subsp. coracana]|uniref:DUF4228 domain protein n=1 Tax=Eleusine coracana subsp. coracana TaxID=191504 RepID=A0AAV5FSB3_ELECO|nr:hypothetical protein QOZ80_1BG0056400 [Eleusine coracana subsp. coracana]GJN37642.1 hypothetical protein PR202_gb26618 [Eleusine coracana subsp. coracana]
MGNAGLMCISLAPVSGGECTSSSSAATKVIHADGTVTRLSRPVRASELMRDHPGQFVCDSARLAVGCRVPGVAADELLRPRHDYFLLPMDMLYSVLTDEEMAALSSAHAATAAASAWKRIVTSAARGRDHHYRSSTNRSPKHINNSGGNDGSARVYPMLGLLESGGLDADKPDQRLGGVVSKSRGAATGTRRRHHRHWQPALDTIEEVP